MVRSALLLALCLRGARGALLDSLLAQQHAAGAGPTVTLSPLNLSLALRKDPGTDVAVFYYSPYGEAGSYSRQVLPLWDEVARWHGGKGTKRLKIAKFSCESSRDHREVCYAAGVRQYPTITFYSYDRLRFGGPLFRKRAAAPQPPQRSANYRGIALYEALRDWTVALHAVSETQRFGDSVKQFLGLKPSPLEAEVAELRQALRDKEAEAFERDLEARMAALRAQLADTPVEDRTPLPPQEDAPEASTAPKTPATPNAEAKAAA